MIAQVAQAFRHPCDVELPTSVQEAILPLSQPDTPDFVIVHRLHRVGGPVHFAKKSLALVHLRRSWHRLGPKPVPGGILAR